MQRIILIIVCVFLLMGCAIIEGKDGRTYWAYDLTDWEEIAQEIKQARDECIDGKRMDCWGDPAGGGAAGGGGPGGGGGE